MAYLLDALVILILIFCVWHGGRRGLVRTVTMLVGGVLAALVALWFSGPLATGVYDTWAAPRLEQSLVDKAAEANAPQVEIQLASLFGGEDGALSRYLEDQGIPASITIGFEDMSEEGIRAAIAPALQDVVRPAAISLLSMALMLLLFLLLMVAVTLLARLVDNVFKLPGLKQLNRVGGLLTGALQGVLWSLVFAVAVRFCADCGLFGSVVTAETVDSSLLVSRAADWLMSL